MQDAVSSSRGVLCGSIVEAHTGINLLLPVYIHFECNLEKKSWNFEYANIEMEKENLIIEAFNLI